MTTSGDDADPAAPTAPGSPPADPVAGGPETPVHDPAHALDSPGGPVAVARGCRCSTLANAAYRAGAQNHPLVDPECPLHRGELP